MKSSRALSYGRSSFADSCEGVSVSCDKSDKAWKLFGGWQFTPLGRTTGRWPCAADYSSGGLRFQTCVSPSKACASCSTPKSSR
jgi:hypothetical protein